MSLYQNRVRIAEEVSEQEALRKKYEIEENVVVKERTFFGKFLLRYLKDIIKVLFAVLFGFWQESECFLFVIPRSEQNFYSRFPMCLDLLISEAEDVTLE